MDYLGSMGLPGGWEGGAPFLGVYSQFGALPQYGGGFPFNFSGPLSNSSLFPMYGEGNNNPSGFSPYGANPYGNTLPFNTYFPGGLGEEEESNDDLP